MEKIDFVRAWKDPLYRASLSAEQLGRLPANPAGCIELSDDQLKAAGGARPITTAITCTAYTWNHWAACCPSTA
jgi:mersacidin/lichenicidin family type 2 lantibiotic